MAVLTEMSTTCRDCSEEPGEAVPWNALEITAIAGPLGRWHRGEQAPLIAHAIDWFHRVVGPKTRSNGAYSSSDVVQQCLLQLFLYSAKPGQPSERKSLPTDPGHMLALMARISRQAYSHLPDRPPGGSVDPSVVAETLPEGSSSDMMKIVDNEDLRVSKLSLIQECAYDLNTRGDLSDEALAAFCDHYLDRRPVRETARDLGVTSRRVFQLSRSALEKVRRECLIRQIES